MFDAAMQAKLRGAFVQAQELMGVPATWTQAKPPHATRNLVVGFSVATLRDEAIVQAYGIGARIFTIKHSDIPSLEKFDVIEVAGDRFVIDGAQELMVNGTVLFYQGFCRGK